MTIPNILTLSRIALIPLFVVLYYCQPTYTDTPIFTWINFSLTGVYAAISMTDYLDSIKTKKLQKIIRTHQSRNLATQRMAVDKAKTPQKMCWTPLVQANTNNVNRTFLIPMFNEDYSRHAACAIN
jgi:hypothetical protein